MNIRTPIELTQPDNELLTPLPIEALILFGSYAQNVASEWSDYDIAVLVKSNLSKQQRKQIYDKVYDLVSKKINRLVDIDIVFLPEAPMELQNHVAKYGKVLYEQNAQVFPRFRESVMRNYADFAPLRQIFQNATLARITP